MIIFLHIPKTAGRYFIKHVHQLSGLLQLPGYPTQCTLKTKIKEKSPQIIGGHYPFEIQNVIEANCFIYISFFRHPVDRWLSWFYHCNIERKSWIRRTINKYNRNEKKVLRACYKKLMAHNVMTRQIGGENLRNISHLHRGGELINAYAPKSCIGGHLYSDSEMEEILERAKNNIRQYYHYIGFQSTVDEDIDHICEKFKWDRNGSSSQIKGIVKKIYFDRKDKDTIKRVQKMNEYDLKLYEFAKDIKDKINARPLPNNYLS
ncbi:hypothetical protein LCGC14_0769070 [marine sediment metagenome]|uniref:Sulfotransferase domain-containing protein n=1 Tax=marine sediment metagenome TaxID=412755 RepID=A0A0F9QIR1_9ZZZZ